MKLKRHLGLSCGIMLLFLIGIIGFYWGTFSLIIENLMALPEAREWAERLHTPEDVRDFIAAHPETVSLVAVGPDVAPVVAHHAEQPRPLGAAQKLWILAAYAELVAAGQWNPSTSIPLADVHVFHLAGTDGGAYTAFWADWPTDHASLDDLVRAMIHGNDLAAMDYLMLRLGRATWAKQKVTPMPMSGLFLSWHNHTITADPDGRLQALTQVSSADYAEETWAWAERLQTDETFRETEKTRLGQTGYPLSLTDQRAFAAALFPRVSAQFCADWLTQVYTDQYQSPEVSRLIRMHLEKSATNTTLAQTFSTLTTTSTHFPGLVTFIAYAQRADASSGSAIVWLMEDVPMAVFYQFAKSGIDRVFQLQLLLDPTFLQTVGVALNQSG